MNNQLALVDTNILVYAFNPLSPFQKQARLFLEKVLPSKNIVLSIQNLTELYAVMTSKKAFIRPLTASQAQMIISEILFHKDFQILLPTQKTPSTLLDLLKQFPAKGAQIHDIHLAAVMIDHKITTIYTADTTIFKKLGLTAINPLI
jgi:predicted nucleic acid-binding protein